MTQIQRQKGNIWIDENKMNVEFKRVTPLEKLRDQEAFKVIKLALRGEIILQDIKNAVIHAATKCYKSYLKEQGEKFDGMATHTFYSFNKAFKIVHEVIPDFTYDENKLILAKSQFQEFVDKSLTKDQEPLKDVIMGAFQTTNGKFDYRKIQGVLIYRNEKGLVDNKDFQKAIDTLQSAKVVNGHKAYDRIYIKDGGKYRQIELQFSSFEFQENGDAKS